MAHPSRQTFLPYLGERLADVTAVFDDGDGIWPTCRRAWELRDPNADYHLVLQDDAILCADFLTHLTDLLTETQRPAYSLYFGRRKMYEERVEADREVGFAVLSQLHWGLAVCLRQDLIAPMLAFGDASDLPSTYDDTRIKTFLRSRGIDVYHPVPSLVDHRTDTVSLATGEPTEPGRKAFYFLGED